MIEKPDTRSTPEEITTQGPEDVADILSRLPANGREDYITRVMDLYEAAERQYRAAQQARSPRIGSSASTSA